MRNTVIDIDVQLVTEDCCSCYITFAIPKDLRDKLVAEKTSFYCPRGHSQSYTGKTEAQKQRERAERLERTVAAREEDLRLEQRRLSNERKAHAATKGQLTKTRKRAEKGVCPAPGCKRSFVNVARHVAHQHPDLADA